MSKESDGFVRAIARGFSVIEALGKPPGRHTLAEAAEAAGLNRATARRILATFVELKYCAIDGRYFSLRPRALGLGLSYLNALPYWAYAQRALEDLRNEIGESCAMAVLDEDEIRRDSASCRDHGTTPRCVPRYLREKRWPSLNSRVFS
jgi:IclR family transcriptional regulator, pca regulon regulatory protein